MKMFPIKLHAILLLFTLSCELSAMEFSIHPNNSPNLNAILAAGQIRSGDAQKLEQLLISLPQKKNTAIYLASPGGSLMEGMDLGMMFRKHRVKTVVEGGEICASACAMAFLGGTDKNGNPWRSSSDNSELGFHAFHNNSRALTSDEVQEIVGVMLIYAREVEAPLETLMAAFLTPSDDMYYLSESEICSLGIKLWSNKFDKFLCQ